MLSRSATKASTSSCVDLRLHSEERGSAHYLGTRSLNLTRYVALVAAVILLLPVAAHAQWHPPQSLTWYWQLTGRVSLTHDAAAYDLDGFETRPALIRDLHAQGRRAICYVDVGTWEQWRPDAHRFPRALLGRGNGWPGERWLDIRHLGSLAPIMLARFRMCKAKGFDAVEPDNIDGFSNRTGFPLTAAQQLRYDKWVAHAVHSLGLAVFQKNDPGQARALQPFFDGVLDEQCNQYSECSAFTPYLRAGKPVLNAEYALSPARFCANDQRAGIMGARFSIRLDGSKFEPCWNQSA